MDDVVNAFCPDRFPTTAIALLASALIGGWLLSRRPQRSFEKPVSWLFALALIGASIWTTRAEHAGFRMLTIIGVTLWSMKAVVTVWSSTHLSTGRFFAFAALWPGMRPELFAAPLQPDRHMARALFLRGTLRLALGLACIVFARVTFITTGSVVAATGIGLVGISLVLHFGLFNWASALWRRVGMPTDSLFIAPLTAVSLGEFWGRRWNLPFTEMTHTAVYRPLSTTAGKNTGALASFAFSGLLHELAISVPVNAGYGLPLAYFALHGALVLLERHCFDRPLGHLWTLFWVAAPLPVLFHPPFVKRIVMPLIGI